MKIILEIPGELVTELETPNAKWAALNPHLEIESIKIEELLKNYLQSVLIRTRSDAQLSARSEIASKAKSDLKAVKITTQKDEK